MTSIFDNIKVTNTYGKLHIVFKDGVVDPLCKDEWIIQYMDTPIFKTHTIWYNKNRYLLAELETGERVAVRLTDIKFMYYDYIFCMNYDYLTVKMDNNRMIHFDSTDPNKTRLFKY